MFDVVKYCNEHFLLRHAKSRGIRVAVSTVMYNAVHVEVETVKLRYTVLCNELRDGRIPLTHPSTKASSQHCTLSLIALRGAHKNFGTPMTVGVVCAVTVLLLERLLCGSVRWSDVSAAS